MKYDPVIPPLGKEIEKLSKRELRAYFDWFLNQVPSRVSQLERAVRSTRSYGHWRADCRPGSLKVLGAWFCRVVEDRKLASKEKKDRYSGSIPTELLPDRDLTGLTLSLCVDTGIYLGEVLRARHQHLFWHQFLTARTWADYGRPVLVEFTIGPVNPIGFAMNVAYGALAREPDRRAFWKQYRAWSKDATMGVRQ
jgi:hypothetical protein